MHLVIVGAVIPYIRRMKRPLIPSSNAGQHKLLGFGKVLGLLDGAVLNSIVSHLVLFTGWTHAAF